MGALRPIGRAKARGITTGRGDLVLRARRRKRSAGCGRPSAMMRARCSWGRDAGRARGGQGWMSEGAGCGTVEVAPNVKSDSDKAGLDARDVSPVRRDVLPILCEAKPGGHHTCHRGDTTADLKLDTAMRRTAGVHCPARSRPRCSEKGAGAAL